MKAGITATIALGSAVALLAIGGATAGASAGHAKAKCNADAVKGADYVYKLTAKNLSCGKAVKLATDFNKCRHSNGGATGKCNGVSGYDCSQKKLDSSPTLLQAKATCSKGSKKFTETFGEFT
jgi:hypothetical protein